uniref:Putative the phosphoinositide binding phox similarity domain of sorting nexin 16 n=1 Tax=Anopheles braziliensis TaxID=58242 RepID=A0A2M3Z3W8_9DIPT
MSLRAIQKRDREKLSSTQRQQHQQQQFISGSGVGGASTTMLLAPPPYQDGTTTTTTTMRMTAGAVYAATSADAPIPSVQSIIQNQQNRQQLKHRNSAATDTTQRPSSSSPPGSTRIRRRSSSFPALLPSRALELAVATASGTLLRSTQSEGDLRTLHNGRRTARGAKTGRGDGGNGGGLHLVGGGAGADSGSSTNNLYLGAKSEVCLKTLAVKNTLPYVVDSTSLTMQQPARATTVTEDRHSRCTSITSSSAAAPTKPRLYESRRNSELLTAGSEFSANGKQPPAPHPGNVRIPIVGYEVMEERARFTIFKLRIENSISHSCWLVLRRYTDFVRLNNKLKALFPHCNLVLPRKKWFGDNFSSGFIDNRIQGLQTFINTILGDDAMRTCQAVRDFFCLDEPPPSYSESMEESRVIFEAQEERISELRQQLQTKEDLVQALQTKLATEVNRNKLLTSVLRNSTEKCAKCAKSVEQQMKESVYR